MSHPWYFNQVPQRAVCETKAHVRGAFEGVFPLGAGMRAGPWKEEEPTKALGPDRALALSHRLMMTPLHRTRICGEKGRNIHPSATVCL